MQGNGRDQSEGKCPSPDEVLALVKAQGFRLDETLRNFLYFPREVQEILAGAAVDWVLASLAGSAGRSVVASWFWLFIDSMYFHTRHAASERSEEECGQ